MQSVPNTSSPALPAGASNPLPGLVNNSVQPSLAECAAIVEDAARSRGLGLSHAELLAAKLGTPGVVQEAKALRAEIDGLAQVHALLRRLQAGGYDVALPGGASVAA